MGSKPKKSSMKNKYEKIIKKLSCDNYCLEQEYYKLLESHEKLYQKNKKIKKKLNAEYLKISPTITTPQYIPVPGSSTININSNNTSDIIEQEPCLNTPKSINIAEPLQSSYPINNPNTHYRYPEYNNNNQSHPNNYAQYPDSQFYSMNTSNIYDPANPKFNTQHDMLNSNNDNISNFTGSEFNQKIPQTPVNPIITPQTPVNPIITQQPPVNPIITQQPPVNPIITPQPPVNPIITPQTPVNPIITPQPPTSNGPPPPPPPPRISDKNAPPPPPPPISDKNAPKSPPPPISDNNTTNTSNGFDIVTAIKNASKLKSAQDRQLTDSKPKNEPLDIVTAIKNASKLKPVKDRQLTDQKQSQELESNTPLISTTNLNKLSNTLQTNSSSDRVSPTTLYENEKKILYFLDKKISEELNNPEKEKIDVNIEEYIIIVYYQLLKEYLNQNYNIIKNLITNLYKENPSKIYDSMIYPNTNINVSDSQEDKIDSYTNLFTCIFFIKYYEYGLKQKIHNFIDPTKYINNNLSLELTISIKTKINEYNQKINFENYLKYISDNWSIIINSNDLEQIKIIPIIPPFEFILKDFKESHVINYIAICTQMRKVFKDSIFDKIKLDPVAQGRINLSNRPNTNTTDYIDMFKNVYKIISNYNVEDKDKDIIEKSLWIFNKDFKTFGSNIRIIVDYYIQKNLYTLSNERLYNINQIQMGGVMKKSFPDIKQSLFYVSLANVLPEFMGVFILNFYNKKILSEYKSTDYLPKDYIIEMKKIINENISIILKTVITQPVTQPDNQPVTQPEDQPVTQPDNQPVTQPVASNIPPPPPPPPFSKKTSFVSSSCSYNDELDKSINYFKNLLNDWK